MSVWYLDASAAVKLVADEPESSAIRAVVASADRVLASVILLAELGAFARRIDVDPSEIVGRIEPICDLVTVTSGIARSAATLATPDPDENRVTVRALDAIHVATALVYARAVSGLLTYDRRQASVARAAGLVVRAPADP